MKKIIIYVLMFCGFFVNSLHAWMCLPNWYTEYLNKKEEIVFSNNLFLKISSSSFFRSDSNLWDLTACDDFDKNIKVNFLNFKINDYFIIFINSIFLLFFIFLPILIARIFKIKIFIKRGLIFNVLLFLIYFVYIYIFILYLWLSFNDAI